MKPIVALATPPINSAIHIIRLSGDNIFNIVNKICKPKLVKKGYQIQLTNIMNNNKLIDKAIVNKYVSPKSFTGEDLIEINCHGGYYLAQKIIKLLINSGCQLARPGEFTMRGVLNNKLNLLQAEAINKLINASNDYAIDTANKGLSNVSNIELNKYKKILFDLIAELEINIDYPDINEINKTNINEKIISLINSFKKTLKISKQISIFNDGINIAIIGDANVGKSSLLNAFVNQDRAIVSDIPGTTRDIIQTSVNIDGISFNFFDTAGLRKTKNKIEKLGIDKSKSIIEDADLILHVIDGSKKNSRQYNSIVELIKDKKHINVINKSDLKCINKLNGVHVSALKKDIGNLINEIKKQFKKIDLSNKNCLLLLTKSSINVFESCLNVLQGIHQNIKNNVPIDLILQDLHYVLNNILELLGEKKDFDFINEMFKGFCIGK